MNLTEWYWQHGVNRNSPKYAMSLDMSTKIQEIVQGDVKIQ